VWQQQQQQQQQAAAGFLKVPPTTNQRERYDARSISLLEDSTNFQVASSFKRSANLNNAMNGSSVMCNIV
jgi:hypothetical protein